MRDSKETGIIAKAKTLLSKVIPRETISKEASQTELKLLCKTNSNRVELCSSHSLAFACIALLFFTSLPMAFAINEAFSIQGRLTDDNNVVVNDSVDINFTIYDASSNGNELWHEYHFGGNQVSVVNGLFNVVIGDINTNKSLIDIDFNSARWLEIAVDGETQSPRIKLNSAASAVIAEKANTLTGGIVVTGDSNFVNIGISNNVYGLGTVTGAKFVSTAATSATGFQQQQQAQQEQTQ